MVFDISVILTKTISIPARYRYGFWLTRETPEIIIALILLNGLRVTLMTSIESMG